MSWSSALRAARRRLIVAITAPVLLGLLSLLGLTACSSPDDDPDAAAHQVQAACAADLAINRIRVPGTDPAVPKPTFGMMTDWAKKMGPGFPPVKAALPDRLDDPVEVVESAIQTAGTGHRIDVAGFAQAKNSIEGWLHDHCGYPTLDVSTQDGLLTGLPPTLPAGPVSIRYTSLGDPARAGSVLFLTRPRAGRTVSAADVQSGTVDLGAATDLIVGAQPVDARPAYALTELAAGRYLVVVPIGSPPGSAGVQAAEVTAS